MNRSLLAVTSPNSTKGFTVRTLICSILLGAGCLSGFAATNAPAASLTVREIHYAAQLSEASARFTIHLDVESTGHGDAELTLFEGDIAVPAAKLPAPLNLVREGNRYRLLAARPGRYAFKLDLVAKVTRAEPWNQIMFTGPIAGIASVNAEVPGDGSELQLLTGTVLESTRTNGLTRARGFLGSDRAISLRWSQQTATSAARQSLVTCETTSAIQLTPNVIKFQTRHAFDLVQGRRSRFVVALPATHALTRVEGDQIRNWQVQMDGERQLLVIELVKPVEKAYALTLFSEQTVETSATAVPINLPQPQEVERESGTLTLNAEDIQAEIDSVSGLRQINAAPGTIAAYRFNARPFTLAARLRRIEPVINVASQVAVRLEESRLLVSNQVMLTVEKAGIYAIEFSPIDDFVVTDVRGNAIEDWSVRDGKLAIHFSSRLLGQRQIEIQLEKAQKEFPNQITVAPLIVTGATRQTAQIGAAAAPGIQLKTAELTGLREIPAATLNERREATLGFVASQSNWSLKLVTERLAPRVVAEIFNLATIGDGLVGGSATIRYGIVNQGVQEFRVQVPAHWKNVEFTGPNIRRRDQQGNLWTIGLQDKAWDGYTLVVTYDHQFDPHKATLDIGGIHALDVERETGSIAITSAASLELREAKAAAPLRRVDENELSDADRDLISRAVLLAYQYAGTNYTLTLDASRFNELPVLQAVADRTQFTTVLTEAGQMLTQASFMVKNNEKQFQTFTLPKAAEFWSCFVNNQPVKAERQGDSVLVPLPRGANRDQTFAVEIVYAQKSDPLKGLLPQPLSLTAPRTDIQTTFAEWELYIPASHWLTRFNGNMTVARGTVYSVSDAIEEFTGVYRDLFRHSLGVLTALFVIGAFIALIVALVKRGLVGLVNVLVVLSVVAVLAGMLLPALSKAKARAQRINAVSNLKQIGVAVRLYANEHDGKFPDNFSQMMSELSSERVLIDPQSGQRFEYIGAGRDESQPDAVIAYSPTDEKGGRVILLADGSAQQVTTAKFADALTATLAKASAANPAGANNAGTPTPNATIAPAAAVGQVSQTASPQTQSPMAGAGPSLTTGVAATASGLRPIRIEIPRTGQKFTFTKVLNVLDEPLTVQASSYSIKAQARAEGALHLSLFLGGLLLVWFQLRRAQPARPAIALGLLLCVLGVGRWLMTARLLGTAMVLGTPVILLLLIILVVRRYWKHRIAQGQVSPTEPGSSPLPPVVASLLLLFSVTGVTADEIKPAANVPSGIRNQASGIEGSQSLLTSTLRSNATEDGSSPTMKSASITSASYKGVVRDRVAELEVILSVTASDANVILPLFGREVAVREFSASSKDVRLLRDTSGVRVQLGRRGDVTLRCTFLVKTGGDLPRRNLAFGIPPALTSDVSFALDEPEAGVEFPSAVSFATTSQSSQTRITAVIGAAGKIDLTWTPRMKRAAEIAATVFCQNASVVRFQGGVMNIRSVLDFQISQGELRETRVRIPAGQRLLRVEGDGIRTWHEKDDQGKGVLTVELLKGVALTWRLTVETEQPVEKHPAQVVVQVPHALDAKRETGWLALGAGDELGVTVESSSSLQKVDVTEFARSVPEIKLPALSGVFRFLATDFALTARVETLKPQIEAIVYNHSIVQSDGLTLTAQVDYTIKQAGVFTLRLAVPDNYQVESVTGTNLAQWLMKGEDSGRQVEATLKERTLGACQLILRLSKTLASLPKSLAVEMVRPLGVARLNGFAIVETGSGIRLRTETIDRLTEVPSASVPTAVSRVKNVGALAFKALPVTENDGVSAWKLVVVTEQIDPWVRAEVVNWLTLNGSLLQGRAVIRYDIQNAPVKEFRLRVPAAFRNVEITGANIRRRDQSTNEWRVELQSKIMGPYLLTVTWEQPWNVLGEVSELAVAGLQTLDTERETGALAVVAKASLRVEAKTTSNDLIKMDPRELPEWAGAVDPSTALAWHYLRTNYALTLSAQRFTPADVLQAIVDEARLTSVVADDGQMMTELALTIRNNGRQHLEITLPPKAEVWSAFVAGRPVRPSLRDGRVLLPLERADEGEAAISIELTFVGGSVFPKAKGSVALVSPSFDVPVKNARWELYLPPDHAYGKFAGSMGFSPEAAPTLQTFSFSDYSLVESKNKVLRKTEAALKLTRARSELAKGNVKEASRAYQQARETLSDGKSGADFAQLEKDLNRVQGSNLIVAQNNFSLNNGLAQTQAPQAGNKSVQYDAGAAEQQWQKLQQAQEVVTSQVRPLRVNLPTRGLRYSFTQVLQTDLRKPMTIEFAVSGATSSQWPLKIALTLLGLLLLWYFATLLTPIRRSAQLPA